MAFIIFLAITIILLFTALSRPRNQAHKKKDMNGRDKLYLDKAARKSAPLPFQQQPQGQTSKGPESGLSLAHDESQRSDQEIAEILAKRARLTIEHHNRQSNLKEVKDAWESSDLDYGQYEEPAIFERSGLRESTTRLEIDYVDRNGTRTT